MSLNSPQSHAIGLDGDKSMPACFLSINLLSAGITASKSENSLLKSKNTFVSKLLLNVIV